MSDNEQTGDIIVSLINNQEPIMTFGEADWVINEDDTEEQRQRRIEFATLIGDIARMGRDSPIRVHIGMGMGAINPATNV